MGAAIPALLGTIAPKIMDFIMSILGKSKLSAEQQAEIQSELLKGQAELQRIEIDAATHAIEAVNATMREEAKSEHWAQWMWRPAIGLTFSATIINNYVVIPLFGPLLIKWGVVMVPIVIPGEVWSAMLVILGVAAGTRGYEKIVAARNGNGGNK